MKYILPLIALVLMVACKNTDIVKYEYRSTTMLGSRTLTITQDSIVSLHNGRAESSRMARATTPQEWQELKAAVEYVKLEEISDLPSPTNRRATDAAAYGSLKLSTADSTYKSASFDGYESHADLLPVMTIIKKIAAIKR